MNARFVRPAAVVLVLAALFLAPSYLSKSQLYSLTDVAIFGLFAISYNLLLGYGGLLSFGHSAYFGLGAYATALSLLHLKGLPLAMGMVIGTAAGTLGGLAIGSICVRRGGPYFAMLTLAFGMLLYVIAWKWRSVTLGDDGFGAFVPREAWLPLIGTIKDSDPVQIYYLVIGTVALVSTAAWCLMALTPFGNAVVSVRQREERASFLGYDVYAVKLSNYAIASGIAGLAGSLFAVFHDFVSTHVIGVELSTDVVMMAFIGGTSRFFGPFLGSAFFVFFGDLISTITERWQMVMGVIFIAMVMYVPNGFAGMIESAAALLRRHGRARTDAPVAAKAAGRNEVA